MKNLIKQFIIHILAFCARITIAAKKPFVISVTGSVGKTTTKEAIAAALAPYFKIGKSEGNFNSEFGLPCQICGMKWSFNPIVWIANFLYFWPKRLFSYPKVLILEMGADKPYGIPYLTSIVKPDIAVICAIGVAHLEKFGSTQEIFIEKFSLLESLKANGLAVVNLDDEGARKAYDKFGGRKISYGIEAKSDVMAKEIKVNLGQTQFSVSYLENADLSLLPALGRPAVLSALAAYAVGVNLGISLQKISAGLKNWKQIQGRMNVYQVGKVTIYDDSYNANPQSVKAALQTLSGAEKLRKWAVLGDMLELGPAEASGHQECAKLACDIADKVVLIGERYQKVLESLPKEKVQWFPGADSAAARIKKEAMYNDAILVKGSMMMKMHKIIDALKEQNV